MYDLNLSKLNEIEKEMIMFHSTRSTALDDWFKIFYQV